MLKGYIAVDGLLQGWAKATAAKLSNDIQEFVR